MHTEEIATSRAILSDYARRLDSAFENDVVIVGAGPAGLTAACYLAGDGKKVTVFEKKLSIGGGVWGGGMMFNAVVVEPAAAQILDDMGVNYATDDAGRLIASSVQLASALCYRATRAGAEIMNCIEVEDIMASRDRVGGVVINWTATLAAGLHVDPVCAAARYVVDATGHDATLAHLAVRHGFKLTTPSGGVEGQGPMSAGEGETGVVEHTCEVCPGLYVCGMTAGAVFGTPRMGPIFGGMLLSGKKLADELLKRL